jgi:hypothetical protein
MPDLDLKSLREIAIEATPELWVAVADSAYGWDHPVVDVPKQDSEFITTFNPVTVLALLDELDLRDSLMAMDKAHRVQLVDEIDRLKEELQIVGMGLVRNGALELHRRAVAENATLRSRIEELEKQRWPDWRP